MFVQTSRHSFATDVTLTEGYLASSDTAPTSPRLTSNRQPLDTGGSALTGRPTRGTGTCFGLSRVRADVIDLQARDGKAGRSDTRSRRT